MTETRNLLDLSTEDLQALEDQLEAERWRRDRVGTGPSELGETIRRWADRCGIQCENLDSLDDYQAGRLALSLVLDLTEEDIDAEVQKVLDNPDRDESFQLDPEPEEVGSEGAEEAE